MSVMSLICFLAEARRFIFTVNDEIKASLLKSEVLAVGFI